MAIPVTCPSCHVRFTVSDQFAGQKGPCPKCKKEIEVPALEAEVKVHAPEAFGPKDSAGRQVLKPVFRQETNTSAVMITSVVGAILLVFIVALAVRFQAHEPGDFPLLVLIGGAAVLGPALSLAGYTFLRDQETQAFSGSELWIRVSVCGLLYAATWALIYLIPAAGFDYSTMTSTVVLGCMAGLGGGIAFASLEMEYLMGILHFGLFLIICLLLRWIVGLPVLPVEIV